MPNTSQKDGRFLHAQIFHRLGQCVLAPALLVFILEKALESLFQVGDERHSRRSLQICAALATTTFTRSARAFLSAAVSAFSPAARSAFRLSSCFSTLSFAMGLYTIWIMRTAFLCGLLLGLGCFTRLPAKAPFTFDALAKIARIDDPQLSPDGKLIAFTVQTVDLTANTKPTQILLCRWMAAPRSA